MSVGGVGELSRNARTHRGMSVHMYICSYIEESNLLQKSKKVEFRKEKISILANNSYH